MLVCKLFINGLFLNTGFLSIKIEHGMHLKFKAYIPFTRYLIQPLDGKENRLYEAYTNGLFVL